MPSPTAAVTTLRPDLGGSMMEFELDMARLGLIATRVLPVLERAQAVGVWSKIPIEELMKMEEVLRAPGAAYSRGHTKFTPSSYVCLEYGLEEVVDDREAKMYEQYFDAELVATQRLRMRIMQAMEMRVAALIFNASTWTGSTLTTAPTHEWDDATNAVPITDVHNAKQRVRALTGMSPNTLICNQKVFDNLKLCNQVKDSMKYQGFVDVRPGRLDEAAIASALGIDRVLVAGMPKNTALEGQTAVMSAIWSDEYAMVCKIATGQDIQEPCVGRTFHHSDDGSVIGGVVESYREERVRGTVVRCRHDVCEKVLYAECGHLISNVTTI